MVLEIDQTTKFFRFIEFCIYFIEICNLLFLSTPQIAFQTRSFSNNSEATSSLSNIKKSVKKNGPCSLLLRIGQMRGSAIWPNLWRVESHRPEKVEADRYFLVMGDVVVSHFRNKFPLL